ncbi:MAG: hypothetical protein GX024_06920 [Clostridiales bacterium]|nr:hypothetical protein [Clostridiales bacterium]
MVKVIAGFKCKYTGRIYHVGDIYDGDKLEEYQAKGYIAIEGEPLQQTVKTVSKNIKPKKEKIRG